MAVDLIETSPITRLEVTTPSVAKASPAWVLALTSVASFMVALDTLVVTNALSTIRVDFGASIEALQWTANAYNLSFAVLLMTGAALGDHFGRRRMLVAGVAVFTAASAASALAPGIGWLIAARAVQGAGAALVMPLAMALLSAAYAPHERARALGLYSGLTGIAILSGPVIGGAIVQGFDWHWIFWLNLPIGLITIVLALGRIPGASVRAPRSIGSASHLPAWRLWALSGAWHVRSMPAGPVPRLTSRCWRALRSPSASSPGRIVPPCR